MIVGSEEERALRLLTEDGAPFWGILNVVRFYSGGYIFYQHLLQYHTLIS